MREARAPGMDYRAGENTIIQQASECRKQRHLEKDGDGMGADVVHFMQACRFPVPNARWAANKWCPMRGFVTLHPSAPPPNNGAGRQGGGG